ncbi:MAG: bifunctional phosphoribosylaminoimidazolecarboxamide formyltransferase/IMP cyclohydrolase [Armatimonadota bacterium]|nr:bifunctional phosphoribosylaminoimidazolecarboxamide formyltransferase/IMP cyclohydrolase [Armatimonadota bacterium]
MEVKVRRALVSVSDKTGVVEFVRQLQEMGVEIISTGGTAKALSDAGVKVIAISDVTGFPEMLEGRVKTLHPAVHGGILADRTKPDHMATIENHGIKPIDMVVVNLYPFAQTVAKPDVTIEDAVENIDIGGPSMVRSAAKNFAAVAIVVDPLDYAVVLDELRQSGGVSEATRARLSTKAYAHTSAYDRMITSYLAPKFAPDVAVPEEIDRRPKKVQELRYGINPNQKPARLVFTDASPEIEVLNGAPGYINMLDALNAWQLVRELKASLHLPAAASFKHVSPAGAAVAVSLSDVLKKSYFVDDMEELSPLAAAYSRARGADRVSSFGDFIALSDVCDASTAKLINREVSDGVIAPGYDEEAVAILKSKRGGSYLVLQIDPNYEPPAFDTREVFGVILEQKRNDVVIDQEALENRVTQKKEIPADAARDLIVSLITLKYTQSNSVCFALDGQTIGVGAGQQSRVHCTRLAGGKADLWWLRQHPTALGLQFAEGISRAEKNNLVDLFLADDITPFEERLLADGLRGKVERMSKAQKREWLDKLTGVSLGSDAFFPFRDSIDRAARSGARYIAQAGGSNRDGLVITAADEYGMVMVLNGIRLFHH